MIALLSVFTTTLTTVNKFLRHQENSTRHRLASQRFLELHRNITEQYLLPFATDELPMGDPIKDRIELL